MFTFRLVWCVRHFYTVYKLLVKWYQYVLDFDCCRNNFFLQNCNKYYLLENLLDHTILINFWSTWSTFILTIDNNRGLKSKLLVKLQYFLMILLRWLLSAIIPSGDYQRDSDSNSKIVETFCTSYLNLPSRSRLPVSSWDLNPRRCPVLCCKHLTSPQNSLE